MKIVMWCIAMILGVGLWNIANVLADIANELRKLNAKKG